MILAIASGKGGTGKTTLAVNLTAAVGGGVRLLDCDVEEPNCHIFLRPQVTQRQTACIPVTERDRRLAKVCLRCPVCRHARRRQQGLAFWLVKNVEAKVCPFCQAYEKVYGRKPHMPQP